MIRQPVAARWGPRRASNLPGGMSEASPVIAPLTPGRDVLERGLRPVCRDRPAAVGSLHAGKTRALRMNHKGHYDSLVDSLASVAFPS